MDLLRLTDASTMRFDSLRAKVNLMGPLFEGLTPVDAVRRARADLDALIIEAKALKLSLGQEAALADRRIREERRQLAG